MEQQLEKLKEEFSIVKDNIQTIILNYNSIKTKIEKLRTIYSDMIIANSHKKIFLFCLESFNFQIKSFSVDSENLNKSLLLLSNRIYCDYYKLFRLIKSLFDDYKYAVPTEISNPPTYDILNPFFEYNVNDISNMQLNVCLLLNALIDYYNNNSDNIQAYTSKSQTGICISNFVKTLEYDNTVLKDQIFLYLSYLDFFKNTQIKHLSKLLHKMNSLKKEINDDIDEDICPVTPNNSVKDDSDGDDGPYLELTTPILMTRSILSNESVSSNSSVSSKVTRNTSKSVSSEASELSSNISEISAKSNTNETSVVSVATVATTSTEKKNEKFVEQNAEEKPAKKKGRPKTKDNAKTKLDKKKEDTDSKGCFAPDTSAKESTDASYENTENFGVTIDQINALSDTVAMVISE